MIHLLSILSILISLNGFGTEPKQLTDEALCYPEFDKQLLRVWIASVDIDRKEMDLAIKAVEEEWVNVQSSLSGITIQHINMVDFQKRVDSYILSMRPCYEKTDFSCLKSIAYHILFEFRSLRQCLYKTEYPLDNLWESIDAYLVIKTTIKDRMFNLKEWFEFEDDINDFICKWEYYDLKHYKEIQDYYPGLNKFTHSELKKKVMTCTNDLLRSIETGFQSNFVMPCDELGEALDELLRMYSKSKSSMLM